MVRLADIPKDVLSQLNIVGLEKLKAFQFFVTFDNPSTSYGSAVLGFDRIEGLTESIEVEAIPDGGNKRLYKFPRKKSDNKLVLRKGLTLNRAMYQWYLEVANWTKGKPSYLRTMSIYLLDRVNLIGSPIAYEAWSFDIYDAWISQWEGPLLDANIESLAFETITLEYYGMSEARGLFSGTTGEVMSILQ